MRKRIFKTFTTEIIIVIIFIFIALFLFSVYSFSKVNRLAVINREISTTIHEIPHLLASIQITFLNERVLISDLESGRITVNEFRKAFEVIEKQEDKQFENLRNNKKAFEKLKILNAKEKSFYQAIKINMPILDIYKKELEEVIEGLAVAHETKDIKSQEVLKSRIIELNEKFYERVDFLTNRAEGLSVEQGVNFQRAIEDFLKGSFLFTFIIFTMLLGFAISLILGLVYSLEAILKGIKEVGKGNLDYQIPLKAQNEFGQIAVAFNQSVNELKESKKSLEGTNLALKKQEEILKQKLEELEKFQKLTVNRELKMIELKNELEKLKK